jgi:hypothetical protein
MTKENLINLLLEQLKTIKNYCEQFKTTKDETIADNISYQVRNMEKNINNLKNEIIE